MSEMQGRAYPLTEEDAAEWMERGYTQGRPAPVLLQEAEKITTEEEMVDASLLFGLPGKVDRTRLILPEDTTYEQWCRVGMVLRFIEEGVHWWIGDWWRYGERKYGEMVSQEARDEVHDLTGYSYSTVVNDAWVASRFEPEERRDTLSYSHHAEVAGMPHPEDRSEWLDRAEAEGWTRNELRAEIQRARQLQAEEDERQRNAKRGIEGIVYTLGAMELLEQVPERSYALVMTRCPDYENREQVREWLPVVLEALANHGRAYIFLGADVEFLHECTSILQRQTMFDYQVIASPDEPKGPAVRSEYYIPDCQFILHVIGPEAKPLRSLSDDERGQYQRVAGEALIRRLIGQGTYEEDTVLDPFAGDGAVVAIASSMGRHARGAEAREDNLAACRERGLDIR